MKDILHNMDEHIKNISRKNAKENIAKTQPKSRHSNCIFTPSYYCVKLY